MMKKNYLFYAVLLLVVVAVVVAIFVDVASQPGVDDLSGNYIELASQRNENNTGPVHRVYLVYTSDTLWNEMRSYGDFMPHTKYGVTRVFFVNTKIENTSGLSLEAPFIPPAAQQYCIGKYEKSPMGEVSLVQFPF